MESLVGDLAGGRRGDAEARFHPQTVDSRYALFPLRICKSQLGIAPLGSNIVLIMTSSTRTCNLLSEFLSSIDPNAAKGKQGRAMMMRKLRLYLWWKGKLSERKQGGKQLFGLPDSSGGSNKGYNKTYGDGEGLSEALKRKDRERAERNSSRRRLRGGAPPAAASTSKAGGQPEATRDSVLGELREEADGFAELWVFFFLHTFGTNECR